MLKIIGILPLFMAILSSCTILPQEIAGSQKIQIRLWLDHSPDMLTKALNDSFALDVKKESIVEFDVKVFGETVYVAYTTDKNVRSSKYPTAANTLPTGITPTAGSEIYKYSTEETIRTYSGTYCEIAAGGAIGTPITHNPGTQNKKGVWVRMFKGTLNKNGGGTPVLDWEPLIITDNPMEIGKIAILPLDRQKATILAVENMEESKKVIVFNDVDQNGTLNIIEDNLLNSSSYVNIDQMNTWVDGTKTYISLVADNSIITGYYQNLIWFPSITSNYKFNIKNMQVKMGSENAYGVWINDTRKELVVAIYQESANISRRWLEIDNLTAIKNPKLNISTYKNSTGIHEDIYIGTVNRNQDFFQLFNIKNLKTFLTGPIISGWNERYAITGNEAGQLLYVRSNFDQQLIFAGLNAFKQWDPIQLVSPPPVGTHPESEIKTFFLNNGYSLTAFKQENGSIYFLAGIR